MNYIIGQVINPFGESITVIHSLVNPVPEFTVGLESGNITVSGEASFNYTLQSIYVLEVLVTNVNNPSQTSIIRIAINIEPPADVNSALINRSSIPLKISVKNKDVHFIYTTIEPVKLDIYNLQNTLIQSLHDSGQQNLHWKSPKPGVYLAAIRSGGKKQGHQLFVVK